MIHTKGSKPTEFCCSGEQFSMRFDLTKDSFLDISLLNFGYISIFLA